MFRICDAVRAEQDVPKGVKNVLSAIDRETFAAEARTHDRLARGRNSFLCHPAAGSLAPPPRRGV